MARFPNTVSCGDTQRRQPVEQQSGGYLVQGCTLFETVIGDTRQQQTIDVYHGMRVVITNNQDKGAGAVHGAFARMVGRNDGPGDTARGSSTCFVRIALTGDARR